MRKYTYMPPFISFVLYPTPALFLKINYVYTKHLVELALCKVFYQSSH